MFMANTPISILISQVQIKAAPRISGTVKETPLASKPFELVSSVVEMALKEEMAAPCEALLKLDYLDQNAHHHRRQIDLMTNNISGFQF